jgi:hypothetical protein
MADFMTASHTATCRARPQSWLQRVLLALRGAQRGPDRTHRIDEEAWSSYMLRDVGLDDRLRGPRDLPRDWPLR